LTQQKKRTFLEAWNVFAAACFSLVALNLLAIHGDTGAQTTRSIATTSALWACGLFLLSFTASSLFLLFPCAWSRWQLRNRRYLGLSCAASFTVHLLAVACLWHRFPEQFHVAKPPFVYGAIGSVACVLMFAMALTSFPIMSRRIRPWAWSVLHKTGSYVLWLSFLIALRTYTAHHPESSVQGSFAIALLTCAMALRLVARIARRNVSLPAARAPR
jgi:DMSO/TMAO reductase YedYZ heme-binding membrane subunit